MCRWMILVYERAEVLRHMAVESLANRNFEVAEAHDTAEVMEKLVEERPDLVILGPSAVSPGNTLDLAQRIRQQDERLPLLLMVANSTEDLAIAALQAGVNEYVRIPYSREDLIAAVIRCLSRRANALHGSKATASSAIDGTRMIGESSPMREIRGFIGRVGPTDSTLLITGETGTGKELVAELVHRNSLRARKPFVTINCAAIPDSLLESELFGYERGAFTGAHSANGGRLKAAEGGTVFLDEIGDMSLQAQAKVLRMIETKEIERLGRGSKVTIDIRVVAATNRELAQLVKEHAFREDLFFRLNVLRVHLPPLRDRKEDIPSLLNFYIQEFNTRFGRQVQALTDEAMECLLEYDWPGNIRELKNLLEAIFVNLPSAEISRAELPSQLGRHCAESECATPDERARLLWALSATNWNKRKAADKLRWSRMTLYRKMARYNISRMSRGIEIAVH